MELQRYMFVNYGDTDFTISITAFEDVDVLEMRTEGEVEQLVDQLLLDGRSSATWEVRVPAGGIRGIGVYNTPSYDEPDPEKLTTLVSIGDNPWPTPPPPPPMFQGVQDYEDRYEAFLMGQASMQARPVRAA